MCEGVKGCVFISTHFIQMKPSFDLSNINFPKINWLEIYKISLIEVLILFTILFFTYTMPLTVNKFSRSLFGKMLILLSIGLVSHYNITSGIVLAVLFIVISEIGYLESFTGAESFTVNESFTVKKEGMKGKDKMEGKKPKTNVQDAKTTFIKENCGIKRATFNLETIQADYTSLKFSAGVCDPCDPTCQFDIDNSSDSLYNYAKIVNTKDGQ